MEILDEAVCISLQANALGNLMNPSIFPPAMDNYQGRLDSLSLIRQPF